MNVDQVLSQANLNSLGCVGYWPFNKNAYDYSGNNNTITMSGTSYIKAKNGCGAINFNGTSSYGTPTTDFIKDSSGIFTMMTWFYQDTTPSSQNVFYDSMATSGSRLVRFHTQLDNTVRIKTSNGTSSVDIYGDIDLGEWIHAAAVRDSSTTYLYINGNLASSATNSTLDLTSHSLCNFGKHPYSGLYYLDGKLADFLAFHTAVPQNQIRKFYNATYIE